MSAEMLKQIDEEVKKTPIIIYAKGTKEQPMCGFSAAAINALKSLNTTFEVKDVTSDQDIWDSIQEYSNWPTFPQVFINGKFVGGCDITLELAENGELKKLVDNA